MAFDPESALRLAAQIQAVQQEFLAPSSPSSAQLSLDREEEEKQVYVEQIKELKGRIAGLEDELRESTPAAAATPRRAKRSAQALEELAPIVYSRSINEAISFIEEPASFAEDRVPEISDQLAALSSALGVVFTECAQEVVRDSPNGEVLRVYRVRGTSHGLSFGAVARTSDASGDVVQLEVAAQSGLESLARPFFAAVQRERSFPRFVRGMVYLCRAVAERRRVFTRLRKERPERVRLPQGALGSLAFLGSANPAPAELAFVLDWQIRLNAAGQLQQSLLLAPRAAPELVEIDKSHAYDLLHSPSRHLRLPLNDLPPPLASSVRLCVRTCEVTDSRPADWRDFRNVFGI